MNHYHYFCKKGMLKGLPNRFRQQVNFPYYFILYGKSVACHKFAILINTRGQIPGTRSDTRATRFFINGVHHTRWSKGHLMSFDHLECTIDKKSLRQLRYFAHEFCANLETLIVAKKYR